MMTKMTSSKPYLIRALYDWIVENDLTPYLLVNAEAAGVEVPQEHVNGGKIILNISPSACRGLHLDNRRIIFTARFAGCATQITLPPGAVLAIYAKENGRGMEFGEEEGDGDGDGTPPPAPQTKGGRKPVLKLVR